MSDGHPYSLIVAYDGRAYHGWQRLKEHPTIQGAIEDAIERAFKERTLVQGAGRTDRGAHAEGQCAGFRLSQDIPPEDVHRRLNEELPQDIRIREARRVPATFHARTSATAKRYEYRIANSPEISEELIGRVWHVPGELDVDPMRDAVRLLIGTHDFASFATKPKHRKRSTVCRISDAGVRTEEDRRITFHFQADSFLMHMVRNIVRALVKVGEGRYEAQHIGEILAARQRSASPGSAPASGLYLVRVYYGDE